MASIPKHLRVLVDNAGQVKRLLEIHGAIAGKGVGYKHDVEVLHKSAIVLLVACWELYVENLADRAFKFLLKKAKTHDLVPARVLALAAEPLRISPDKRAVWGLAGDGWRTILQDHKTHVLREHTGTFRTPTPENIDTLFLQLIGLKGCSNGWQWHGMPNKQCRHKLENLINLRHDIAHRVNASASIKKSLVEDYVHFVHRLAAVLSNDVGVHLHTTTKVEPWILVKYGPKK